jgi:hypothetical protein
MTTTPLLLDSIDPGTTRLYGIVARAARRAVVFRRGPSRRVRLLDGDLATDTITPEQWFKGRVYERRCDLSPSGDRLVYFAASFRQPLHSRTTISRPPWFTDLERRPKGDCWGGGGLFHGQSNLRLNHRPGEFEPVKGPAPPESLRVTPLGDESGRGEDEPILSTRLAKANEDRSAWNSSLRQSITRSFEASVRWITILTSPRH